jgi:predicted anti-sigma-YlaC factor YlaD
MKNQDQNREKQLERLFLESRALLPGLEPDPTLPAHIRALVAADAVAARALTPRRRWAWLSLAGATVALSIFAGGYVGYRAWVSTQETASEQMGDADLFGSALAQSGFADDVAGGSEVEE